MSVALNKPRMSRTQMIADSLREQILLGTLPPSSIVLEGQLAEEFESSKTPVREALHTLVSEGLIEVLPKKGYLVSPMTQQDLSEVMDLRMLIEPHAAAEAARLATPQVIAKLEGVLHEQQLQQEEAAKGNNDATVSNDARRFHEIIARACGNDRLHETLSHCFDETSRAHHVIGSMRALSEQPEEIEEHAAIFEAIKSGSQSAAHEAMRQHLVSIRKAITALSTSQSYNLWD